MNPQAIAMTALEAQLHHSDSTGAHLNLMCSSVDGGSNAAKKERQDTPQRRSNKKRKYDTLLTILSAMYAKLIVVMGIGFPLAEAISPYIPSTFYKAFYVYLYCVSIAFLVYAYVFLVRDKWWYSAPFSAIARRFSRNDSTLHQVSSHHSFIAIPESPSGSATQLREPLHHKNTPSHLQHRNSAVIEAKNCGSFYLRVGAVAFGIGSMIYSGLEFVQYFELDPSSDCYGFFDAISPVCHMIFTFIQLYFIFLNSKMCLYKYKNVARFGLMHMVGTNLSVWLLSVVQESKHEILNFYENHQQKHNAENRNGDDVTNSSEHHYHGLPTLDLSSVDDSLTILHCRRSAVIGQLVQDASAFLFPCTIEYSLTCAAIAYIMWKHIGTSANYSKRRLSSTNSTLVMNNNVPRVHHYRVDCTKAIKGMFTGILVLVFAIISVIIFYVFTHTPEYKEAAVLLSSITEMVLFTLTTMTCLVAIYQIRELRYNHQKNFELDNILLVVAQMGVYLFSIFTIISGCFHFTKINGLVAVTALLRLIQASVQTVFILDASQRNVSTQAQAVRRPGREMITFLLVSNFSMWVLDTLRTGKAEYNPVQMEFYGFWGWTIVARITTPLAIFFRFHSTVCLCEIWKKIYKLKV